jgi:hypothetical protein
LSVIQGAAGPGAAGSGADGGSQEIGIPLAALMETAHVRTVYGVERATVVTNSSTC